MVARFFGLSKSAKCIHLRNNPRNVKVQFEVFSSESEQGTKTIIGKIVPLNRCIPPAGVAPAINVNISMTIRFDETQNVYTKEELGQFKTFVFGPALVDFGCQANFEDSKGKKAPVYYRLGAGFHEILGFVGGSIRTA